MWLLVIKRKEWSSKSSRDSVAECLNWGNGRACASGWLDEAASLFVLTCDCYLCQSSWLMWSGGLLLFISGLFKMLLSDTEIILICVNMADISVLLLDAVRNQRVYLFWPVQWSYKLQTVHKYLKEPQSKAEVNQILKAELTCGFSSNNELSSCCEMC